MKYLNKFVNLNNTFKLTNFSNELNDMIKNCEREIKKFNIKIKREEKMQKLYQGIQNQNENIN